MLLAATAYFSAAAWLRHAHVDAAPAGSIVIQLLPPFDISGHAAVVRRTAVKTLDAWADDATDGDDGRSPVVVYEDNIRLGPAHSNFGDISLLGRGRFAHWRTSGLVFSASDNSDPNTNGRHYFVVVPEKTEIVVELRPPFERYDHAVVVGPDRSRPLDRWADDETNRDDVRSPLVIYEDGIRLGPAHSGFTAINELGKGRYAHWRSSGIVFSASDNSDPNTNGRHYQAVVSE